MPTISMFYGILILMYFYDNKKHNCPHIHAEIGQLVFVQAINLIVKIRSSPAHTVAV